jgi:phosphoribosylformimino-5-aminoimidazole carboxamide ribotide isomerase
LGPLWLVHRPDRGRPPLTFEVIPAIDLRGGRCVRLFQGDYARETSYSDDPVAVARQWQELGALRIHVVDLDGARLGEPVQSDLVRTICRAVATPIEVSGGLRTPVAIETAFANGARRVQLGSAAVKDPALVREACRRFPGAICVGIDARDGIVQVQGWTESGDIDAFDLALQMVELGVPRLMFTDIARDSTQSGPNIESLSRMVKALPVPIVASGGVASITDLARLAEIGCEGAIVGKALYEAAFTLPQALAAVS